MVDLRNLKDEIQTLRVACQQMYQEIDDFTSESSNTVITWLLVSVIDSLMFSKFEGESHPNPAAAPTNVMVYMDEEDGGWNCHACTFRNYPALNKCEECQTPRPQGPSNISSQIIRGSGMLLLLIVRYFLDSVVSQIRMIFLSTLN